MNQTVTFRNPKNDIIMLPSRARSDRDIIVVIGRPEHRLNQVGGTFGFTKGNKSRKRCDTCLLISNSTFESGILPDTSCVQDKNNSSVCRTDIAFGRPCCTWTDGLASLSKEKSNTVDTRAKSIKPSAALVCMPITDIPESLQSSSQELRTIENDNQIDHNGSDYDDNDLVVEYEDDDDIEDS
jgi:hypothetical protein